MDTRQNVEYKMVSEFISKTGANPDDALACLKTWGWDMKRALTDYNDTCAVDLIDLIDEDDENSKESVVVLRNNSSSLNNKYKQQQQQQQQQQQKYQEINKTIAPVLCKQDSIDLIECKKLFRGISRATDNVGIVSRARHEIAKDFYKSLKRNDNTNNFQYLVDTPDSTFILPNIYNYPEDFRIFIEKDLIEMSTLNALEQSQRLNWWADSNVCRKLWPLATTGDGNCLLHAASLGIWGFHDRKLTLRTALYSVLSDGKFKDELRRRWRFQQTQFNKRAGFVYSESEWSKEWDDIISMASPEPRKSINNHNYNNPTTTTATTTTTTTRNNDDYRRRISFLGRNSITENEVLDNNLSTSSSSTTAATTAAVYESLEEIHILALAHVLRRAIIVISDTVLKDLHGEAMAPITFGGIYLPFEIEPKECNRGPLLLAYDMAHFSALVPMENGSDYPPALVPLTDYENILLPIQFCIDPGEDFDWKLYNGNEDNWSLTEREHIALLKEYLDVVYVATNRSPDDEIYEDIEDEFEKKFIESEIIIPTSADYITTNTSEEANNNNNCNGKSKASRQLHSVAKQFGSIGKNMSRKLKKNIGSIAKLGGKNVQKKNSFTGMGGTSLSPPYICSRILCARLRLKRHEYQEEMIRNYLECAQNRFIEAEKNKEQKLLSSTGNITGTTIQQQQQPTVVAINTGINTLNKDECSNNGSSSRSNNRSKLDSLSNTQNDNNMSILQQQEFNEHSYCINAGCNQLATFETSYLCPECFEKQKKHENLQYFNSSPRYGTGNSKFYTQADIQSHDSIRKLPSLKKLNELDQTLYLSNSTFYNDVLPSYDEVEHLNNRESHRKYTTSISSSSHQPLSASSSSSSSSTTTPSPSQSQSSSNGSCNNAINNKKSLSAENNSSLLSPVLITKIHISNDNDDNERNRKNNLHQHLHLKQQQQQPHNHQLIVTGITSPSSIPITKPCKTLGCPFYGNSSTNFLCSKCLKATTGSIITTSRNQHDYDYYQHNKNYNHNHSHHNESSFKSNPIYTAPSPTTPPPPPPKSATSTTTLYKSESKITSDI